MHLLLILFTFFGATVQTEENNDIPQYIAEHKDLAMSEMKRTGIPASIKLAQALLESNHGRSELATEANNHFGIKCGGNWNGMTYYKKDDDYKNGKLVNSCFRHFSGAIESFRAHSDLLSNPKKKYRYGFLFKYDSKDYESWAYGLLDAGYATDLSYPEKLIALINKYELYQYDGGHRITAEPRVSEYSATAKKSKDISEMDDLAGYQRDASKDGVSDQPVTAEVKNGYKTKEINLKKLVVANGGETVYQLAQKNNLNPHRMVEYNERLNSTTDKLLPGEYVYFEEKSKSFVGNKKNHTVKKGETMYSIAQTYGMKLSSLYFKNRLPKYAEPEPGEVLNIQGFVQLGKRPKFIDATKSKSDGSKFIF